MNPNSKLERLKKQRNELQIKVQELVKAGKLLQANVIMGKIKKVDEAITEAEAYLPKRLSELFDRKTLNESGINVAIVKVHLAADFLADCAYDLKDRFDKLGVVEQNLLPLLDEIKKKSQDFASIVCHPEFAGLSDFMVTNDDFINDMHGITQKYIDEHLSITDEKD